MYHFPGYGCTIASSIHRWELCVAVRVLAVQLSETVSTELDIGRNLFRFFSDRKVVLCYIHNATTYICMLGTMLQAQGICHNPTSGHTALLK